MAYLTEQELQSMGFSFLGKNVKVSDKASIYNCNQIEIGNNSRIDDFCVVSGRVEIGSNVHITPMCLLAGGKEGIILENYTTLAYGVKIFTQSDDYSGQTLTNSTIPKPYKNEIFRKVIISKHSIIGASSTIMPGVILGEGTSIGAMSLVLQSTKPWGVYVGIPIKRIKERSKKLLVVEKKYMEERNDTL